MIMATWKLLFPINRKQFNSLNFFCIREFASAQDFITSESKHSIEEDSLPSKPKKPPNVFLLYYTSVKNQLREEHPHCTQRELLKKASERWAQADPTIKQNLQKQYLEQTSMYKQKLMDYENSLTDEQKMKIIEELLKKGYTLKKGEIKQKLTELGKPKRPLSPFMLFLQNKKITKKPQESHKDWLNNVTEEWKNMTIEAKTKYSAEAKDLLDKYKIEMKKWEEDMIQDSECPNQYCMSITESIAANFPNVRIKNKENIKIGWGTDITQCTSGKDPEINIDRQHESTESIVLYNNKNILRTALMEYPKNTAMDTSTNNDKKLIIQPHDTHIQIYIYFVSIWKRVLTILKEIRENWKTVREYIFIGTVGILISIFCVLNLMYK